MMISVTACQTTQKIKSDSYCMHGFIIPPTSKDVEIISDKLVQQLLVNNERYSALCKDYLQKS